MSSSQSLYVGPVSPERAKLLYEVASLDGRGRINFHARWCDRAGWGKADLDVLFVLESPGLITCLPWERNGQAILERYSELEQALPPDWVGLSHLHDRYHRVSIGTDRRVTLSELMQLHVGVEPGSERCKLVAMAFPGSVVLMSIEERARRLAQNSRDMQGLP